MSSDSSGLERLKQQYPDKFLPEETVFEPDPAGRPDLHRHGVRRAAAPGPRAHRLRQGAPEGVLRRRDHPGLDARRRALHRRAAQVELPLQLVLRRRQHPGRGQRGPRRLHADLPVAGAGPVPPAGHRRSTSRSSRRRCPTRTASSTSASAWTSSRPRSRSASLVIAQVNRADAARPRRRLPARQRHRLPRARTTSRCSSTARRCPDEIAHAHRPLRRAHRRGRRHDPGRLRQRAERHPVGARPEEAPRRPHRAAHRRHRRT